MGIPINLNPYLFVYEREIYHCLVFCVLKFREISFFFDSFFKNEFLNSCPISKYLLHRYTHFHCVLLYVHRIMFLFVFRYFSTGFWLFGVVFFAMLTTQPKITFFYDLTHFFVGVPS